MKKILIGLGNPLGQDDAVGLRVAEALRGTDWQTLATPALENVLGVVQDLAPEILVVVDAAEMGLPPGSVRRLPLRWYEKMLASTHGLPLPFLLSLLKAKEVVLIGIQPKDRGFGESLSPEVANAAGSLVQLLKENRVKEIPQL